MEEVGHLPARRPLGAVEENNPRTRRRLRAGAHFDYEIDTGIEDSGGAHGAVYTNKRACYLERVWKERTDKGAQEC